MIKACVLSIGDEILIGQVVNTNAAHLSSELTSIGIQVTSHITCMDEPPLIKDALEQAAASADIVLCTGGLGPTEDDKTKQAIAEYFDDELIYHASTYDRLEALMERYDRQVTPSQRLQCYLPSKAIIYDNDLGTAPGMELKKDDVLYFFMPGVPSEMRVILSSGILPKLAEMSPHMNRSITLSFIGIGESRIEALIKDHLGDTAPVDIAYLPNKSIVRMRLSGYDLPDGTLAQLADKIKARLGDFIYAGGDIPIVEVVSEMLRAKGLTVGFAESCTGGAVSALMTSQPGASDYYQGSIISYANELKINLLGVDAAIITKYGAVSGPCAEAMASGARKALGTDIAVSLTGIAGPSGGSAHKPVGTLYVGISSEGQTSHHRFLAGRERTHNIAYFTQVALNVLRQHLST